MFRSLLSKQKSEFGLLIDIGSGSTLASVVASHHDASTPEIIWSSREHQPLHPRATPEQITKAMITSLMNASLAINTQALHALHAKYPRAKIESVQVTVAAPWSYTIPQTITYTQPTPIRVSAELIRDLTEQADQKVDTDLKAQTAIAELGLSITHRMLAEVTCNGYVVREPEDQIANTITLTQLSAIAHSYLIEAVTDIQQKTLPAAELLITTSMLALYETLRTMRPTTSHAAIVSVGYEATEIGVIRDGILAYTTHTPVGLYTLVRQLSEQTNIPAGEIFGYFGSPEPLDFMTRAGEQKQAMVKATLSTYEQTLSELFLETGDGLILPSTLLLNCEAKYAPLLEPSIKRSVKKATHNQPTVELLTSHLTRTSTTTQSVGGIELATAQLFHIMQQKQSE